MTDHDIWINLKSSIKWNGKCAVGTPGAVGLVPRSVCLPLSVIAVSLSPRHTPLQHLPGSNPTHIISEGEEVAGGW